MRLSDDKINHLSHVVVRSLKRWEMARFLKDENTTRLAVKDGLLEGLAILERVEEKVKASLQSYSRKIIEGSREWDIMFAKAFEEELHKIKPAKD